MGVVSFTFQCLVIDNSLEEGSSLEIAGELGDSSADSKRLVV